ncbi:hypothetical protein EJD97_013504 [Solanum chilense]|uniref:Uncharacterized protein n=1 Tax=Solanum chilense TaxID=4083 RepID=A0A6N2BDK8_SOLCI|nr:hypothetical protein EJD97_013504 [Solanum chilense]
MSNVELMWAVYSLTQLYATLVSRDKRVQVIPNANITTSRIMDFTRMNPPTFYGFKVEEEPQGFIDEVFKVLNATGVSSQEKAAYQLKVVAQVLYEQCKDDRLVTEGRITWGAYKTTFLDRSLVAMGNWFYCGKSDHMNQYLPLMKTQGGENIQAQSSSPNPHAPKKNLFYALQS